MKHLVILLCIASSALAADRPNILFILTDDQGHGDLGAHGNPTLQTPHLDQFCEQSVRFTDFSVASSCSPTRASLLSGQHHLSVGVTHTIPPRERLKLGVTLLPEVLKTAGYKTACIGKWHLGHEGDYAPSKRGFDVSFDQQEPMKKGHYREDVLFDRAMTFMADAKAGQPFFCYLATHSPHAPLVVPEKYAAPYRSKVDARSADFLGMVANIDENLGRLMLRMKERGLDENTIIVFMNDNGGTWGLDVFNSNMRGHKATAWPGGSRAMSFWRWPGHWLPRDVAALTAHVDVFPTLVELAGATTTPQVQSQLQGHSLTALLSGKDDPWFADRCVFQHVGRWPSGKSKFFREDNAGIRWRQYLFLRTRQRETPPQAGAETFTKDIAFHRAGTPNDDWALYDVRRDPRCETALTAQQPEITARLRAAYLQWWDALYPQMVRDGADAPLTGLPGMEAPIQR